MFQKNNGGFIEQVYSVDMIRLKCYLLKEEISKVLSEYNVPNSDYWSKSDIKSYRHNWSIKDINSEGEECSMYACCSHNSKNDGRYKTDFVLEFNPNKCKGSKELMKLLGLFSFNLPVVQSVDIAVDIYNLNINWLTLNKGNKRSITTFDKGGDDKTYYLGESGQHLRVKVYNKAKERSKKGKGSQVPCKNWTRYEITLKPNSRVDKVDSFKIDKEIPNITCVLDEELDKLDANDKVLLKAIRAGIAKLTDLSRRKKEKLRPYVEAEYKQLVNPCQLENALKKYVKRISAEYFFLNGNEYAAAHYIKS